MILRSTLLGVLRDFFINRRKICIFILRGGLGNQLYQLSALAFMANKLDFIPFVYEYDLRSARRNGYGASYRVFNFDSWFPESRKIRVLEGIEEYLVRVFLSMNRRFKTPTVLTEIDFENEVMLTKRFVLIRGSFQNKKYPMNLPETFLDSFFPKNLRAAFRFESGSVAVHIRLTDFLPENPFDFNYYKRALEVAASTTGSRFECYSDDIGMAIKLLDFPIGATVNWPEEERMLKPEYFLYQFSRYKVIIASKSSLCWWASYISWKSNPNVQIIHPWAEIEDFLV
jgi:hypothetical protein